MEKHNIIQEKSFDFALRIIKLYKYLVYNKKEYILSKQILRSGTSVGANIEEAIGSQTKKEFFSKITISYKELRETNYWLRLLTKSNYLTNQQFISIYKDGEELLWILTKIQKTTKQKISRHL